jgi:hypothetical protein
MKQHNQQTLFTWPRLRQAFTAILLVVFSVKYASAQGTAIVSGMCGGTPWTLTSTGPNTYEGVQNLGAFGPRTVILFFHPTLNKWVINAPALGQYIFSGTSNVYGPYVPTPLGEIFCAFSLTAEITCSEIAWYRDADGDTYGTPNDMVMSCTEVDGYVDNDFDCDDTHPQLPQTWFMDSDGDGYGSTGTTIWTCEQPEGYAPQPCSAPIGASVSSITSVNAKVDFDGLPEGAFRCAVWYRVAGTEDAYTKKYATGDQTEVNLNNLTPDTEYEWKMRTRCGLVDGDTSQFVTGANFTTLSACNANVNEIRVFASYNWARIRWASSPNAVSYKLRYKLRAGGPWTSKIIAAPTLSKRIYSLLENTEYEYTLEAICANGVSSSRSAGTFSTIIQNGRLSDDSSEEWAFSIHPNPSNGRFTVTPLADAEGVATVQLFDVAGRVVLQQTWNAREDATLVLDKQLDNGMYMLSITAADGHQFSSRVVIAN